MKHIRFQHLEIPGREPPGPKVSPFEGIEQARRVPPATVKQLDFIDSLCAQLRRDPPGKRLNVAEASELISRLMGARDAQRLETAQVIFGRSFVYRPPSSDPIFDPGFEVDWDP
jgi:hypothetical protein